MRKLVAAWAIAIAFSQLTGCLLMQLSKKVTVPTVGAQVPEGKVAVVGKISYNPEPKQNFKANSSWDRVYGRKMYVVFGPDSQGGRKLDAYTEIKWDEYFVRLVPRKETSLVYTQTILGTKGNTQTSLQVFWRQRIPVEPEDFAVYMGDIAVQFDVPNSLGGKDDLIVVTDGFEEAKRQLDGYKLRDASSGPVTLNRRLVTGVNKAEVRIVAETHATVVRP
jgi:hypothetical protein